MSGRSHFPPYPTEEPVDTIEPEGPDGEPDGPLPVLRPAADRYEIGDEIAHGAMGRIVAATDRELRRRVALKLMTSRTPGAKRRFIREAQIAAQLDHPNVAPVHELGILATGELYYAMKLVHGRTLADVLDDFGRNRLLGVLAQVAMGVGYAHAKGIVHRDLKPENVMVGRHGEVYAMDWGIAKLATEADRARPEPIDLESASNLTVDGSIFGTPEYMSPEQATGQPLGPRSDVYSLGVILFEILTGKPRYPSLPTWEILRRTAHVPVDPAQLLGPASGVPEEIGRVCLRALERRPSARHASATELGEAIRAFLEGAERERQADERAADARVALEAWRQLAKGASGERETLALRAKGVGPHDPIEKKRALWRAEEGVRAADLRRDAALARVEELCEQALGFSSGHAGARACLASLYRMLHEEAESEGDLRAAANFERLLRRHDAGEHASYLDGTATVRVETDPPGATVVSHVYGDEDGLLRPGAGQALGTTPLDARLPFGSWLLVLSRDGAADVRHAVLLARSESYEARVRLPDRAEVGVGFAFVPAGRFVFGSDGIAPAARPRAVLTLPDFAIAQFPVTFAEYAEFLNALPAQEAARRAPRVEGEDGVPIWKPESDGRYRVPFRDADGDLFEPDFPVALVGVDDAEAYAAWRGRRDGASYRLPSEQEWEKAGRGADGRPFPWGHRMDPCLALMLHSRPGRPWFGRIGLYETDESPYGVRDMAGGIRDWTASPAVEEPSLRVAKGGAFSRAEQGCRLAFREPERPSIVSHYRGFRLARSL